MGIGNGNSVYTNIHCANNQGIDYKKGVGIDHYDKK